MKNAAITNLVNRFMGRPTVSRQELFEYFKEIEGELKESTFAWRLYDLKRRRLLVEVGRGVYSFNFKPPYIPVINEVVSKIAGIFNAAYKDVNYCVWNINWINEFAVHQSTREEYLIETEKDLQESIAYSLSDNGFKNIILEVKGTHIKFYDATNPIIILPLVSRAPIQFISLQSGETIAVPTLEKMLVDIFDDVRVFYHVQGAEMERIFKNAIMRYSFNTTTFFAYAKRRGKEVELRELLTKLFPDKLLNPME